MLFAAVRQGSRAADARESPDEGDGIYLNPELNRAIQASVPAQM
jgi:hypothetical protein